MNMKTNVKKFMCILLISVMTISTIAGCGSSKEDNTSIKTDAAAQTESSDGKIKVSVGISADNQPYSYMDENEQYAGYEYELIMECSKRLADKYEFDIVMDEWTNLLVGIDTGTYDFAAGSFGLTDERKEKYIYATEGNLWDTPFRVGYLKGRTDITDLNSLAGMTIATTPGLMAEQLVLKWNEENPDKTIKLEYPDGYETIYSGMENGLYDGYIGTSIELNTFNSRFDNFMEIGDVDLSSDTGETGVYFIYSKKDAELAEDMDKCLAEMREDGTMSKICIDTIGDDFTQKK